MGGLGPFVFCFFCCGNGWVKVGLVFRLRDVYNKGRVGLLGWCGFSFSESSQGCQD